MARAYKVELEGMEIGLVRVLKRLRKDLYRCVCTRCGQLFDRNRYSLLGARNKGTGLSFCGECYEPEAIRNSIARDVLKEYRKNADKRGYEFELELEDVKTLVFRPCLYCGDLDKEHLHHHYTGIDRVNNELGYSKSNVVPCCKVCNRAKMSMTMEEWSSWLARIRRLQ